MNGEVNLTGVHASHCCVEHGCKYGDEDCPVVSGSVPQLYSCESCESDEQELQDMSDDYLRKQFARLHGELERRGLLASPAEETK